MSLRSFMTTQPREIGSISTSTETKMRLADLSKSWKCKSCRTQHSHLLPEDVHKMIVESPCDNTPSEILITRNPIADIDKMISFTEDEESLHILQKQKYMKKSSSILISKEKNVFKMILAFLLSCFALILVKSSIFI